MLDILIRNGTILDGTGRARYRADVGILGDRLAAIGDLQQVEARVTVDATGQAVSPGFVDMHSHADFSLPGRPTADSLVRQGITTVVAGQCGFSLAPLLNGTRDHAIAVMDEPYLSLSWEWDTFGSYLKQLQANGISLNLVPFVGHSTVKIGVMGADPNPPNAGQLATIQRELERAMADGAVGISTGLIYPPGSLTSTEELIETARPVAQRGGSYFSHIRGEGSSLIESVSEAIRIGRECQMSVEISHFKATGPANWPKSSQALALIDQARLEGVDVYADMYPYLAASTDLVALLPDWAQAGGTQATVRRLADPDLRRQMTPHVQAGGVFSVESFDDVLISLCQKNPAYEGHTVAELAARMSKTPVEWILDALIENELAVEMVIFGMSEENRQQEMRHPAMMFGTDGFGLATEGTTAAGRPHPRSFGTFPLILSRYVRDLRLLTLEEAAWKMSGLPAVRLGWTDRGSIKEGLVADLVVFDPDAVADRATYQEPYRYPVGIQTVVVGGTIVVQNGQHTGARPGRVLTRF